MMKKKIVMAIGLAALMIGATGCSSKPVETVPPTVETTTGQENGAPTQNGSDTGADTQTGSDAESGAEIGAETEPGAGSDAGEAASGAVGVFEAIWNQFTEAEMFPVMGGGYDAPVDGKPGAVALTSTDVLTGSFYVPADMYDSMDDVATMMHMMNANTFTGVVAHVTGDTAAFAEAVKTNIQGTQWICGFPDKLYVIDLGDSYIAYAFGEASIMESFKTNALAAYPSASVLSEVNLAE